MSTDRLEALQSRCDINGRTIGSAMMEPASGTVISRRHASSSRTKSIATFFGSTYSTARARLAVCIAEAEKDV